MIGIVNYGAGNIFSLTAALMRAGLPYGMINEPGDFEKYDRYIIPGVGHAGAAMRKLQDSGLADYIPQLTKPVLGICVGMQLMTSYSEEGDVDMTHIFPMKTLHFSTHIDEKVPHMGWNSIQIDRECPLFADIQNEDYFYFVHSYFIEYSAVSTAASCKYGVRFSASIWKENFYGVQFHPEKSGISGEKLLKNFATL